MDLRKTLLIYCAVSDSGHVFVRKQSQLSFFLATEKLFVLH